MQPNQQNQPPQQQPQYPPSNGPNPAVAPQQTYVQPQQTNPGVQQQTSIAHEQPIDYLNQISTNAPNHSNKSKFLMIIIIVLSLLSVVFFALSTLNKKTSPTEQLVNLSLRVSLVTAASEEYSEQIRDSDLLKNSSDLNISLANIEKSIAPALASDGVEDATSYSKTLSAKSESYDTELRKLFDKSILDANFDSAYARQMAFEITEIRALLAKVYSGVDTSVKESLVTIDSNLEAIEKELRVFVSDK